MVFGGVVHILVGVVSRKKIIGCKPVIGLVGGIGCGKSLVARQLAGLGCAVIDSDALAHAAIQRPEVRSQLVEWWGPEVLNPDGTVNRKAVASRVFDNPEELKRLEKLIHPLVHEARRRLHGSYATDPKVLAIVEDSPLLIESQIDRECDAVIFVDASWANRLQRLAQSRGWSERELSLREKNQAPLDKKLKAADYMVDNNAGEDECLLQVRRVFSKILQDLAQHS